MKKTSEYIKEIRALRDMKPDLQYYKQLDGEHIPNIYQAHMSALETERQLEHARGIVAELYELLEGSVEGPGLDRVREDEIAGLLLLWNAKEMQAADAPNLQRSASRRDRLTKGHMTPENQKPSDAGALAGLAVPACSALPVTIVWNDCRTSDHPPEYGPHLWPIKCLVAVHYAKIGALVIEGPAEWSKHAPFWQMSSGGSI